MKPTVPEVAPLVRLLFRSPDGPVGCCLHILLSDGNVGAGAAEFCRNQAREKGHADCERLAELLMQMSPTQHKKLEDIDRKYDFEDDPAWRAKQGKPALPELTH